MRGDEKKEKCCVKNGNFNRKVTIVEKYKEQKMQDRYALPLFRVQEQFLWINEYNYDVNSKIMANKEKTKEIWHVIVRAI